MPHDGDETILELVAVGANANLGVEGRRVQVIVVQAGQGALLHAATDIDLSKVRAKHLVPAEDVELRWESSLLIARSKFSIFIHVKQ